MDESQIEDAAQAAVDFAAACGCGADEMLDILSGNIVSEEDAAKIRRYIIHFF